MPSLNQRLLENNFKINDLTSLNGWEIVHERSEIYESFIRDEYEKIVKKINPSHPYALVSLGGFGRGELAPNSDIDLAHIVDADVSNESNSLLVKEVSSWAQYDLPKLIRKKIDLRSLNMQSINSFNSVDLNAALDLKFISGQNDFYHEFREKIIKSYDRGKMYLHNLSLWQEIQQKQRFFQEVSNFDIKSGLGGMRHFNMGAWFESIESFLPSLEIYNSLDRDILESAGILLKIRSWLNLKKDEELAEKRKIPLELLVKNEKEHIDSDIMQKADFIFLPFELRERLMDARMNIHQSTKSRINQKVRDGVPLEKNIFYTNSGVIAKLSPVSDNSQINESFYHIVRITQERGLPFDDSQFQTIFRNPKDWFVPDRKYGGIFYLSGRISSSKKILESSGLINRIFLGYSKLQARVNGYSDITVAGEYENMLNKHEELISSNIESEYSLEFKNLDFDSQAAFNLILFLSNDFNLINNAVNNLDISKRTAENALFLSKNKGILREMATERLSDDDAVSELISLCNDKEKLRSLYILNDLESLASGNSMPEHILSNVKELYQKGMKKLLHLPLKESYSLQENNFKYYTSDQFYEEYKDIISDLGPDFMGGQYKVFLPKLLSHIIKMSSSDNPIIKEMHANGDIRRLSLVSKDFPGLISVLSGACYTEGISLRKLHAYTMSRNSIAIDFFDISSKERSSNFLSNLEGAISQKRFIDANPYEIINGIKRKAELKFFDNSKKYRLILESEEDTNGITYALSRILYENVCANIYGMHSDYQNNKVTKNIIFFNSPLPREEVEYKVKESLNFK